GLAGGQLRVVPGVGETGIPFESRVVIPFWGTKAELAEVIALAGSGRISAHVERFVGTDACLRISRRPLPIRQLMGQAPGRLLMLRKRPHLGLVSNYYPARSQVGCKPG